VDRPSVAEVNLGSEMTDPWLDPILDLKVLSKFLGRQKEV